MRWRRIFSVDFHICDTHYCLASEPFVISRIYSIIFFFKNLQKKASS